MRVAWYLAAGIFVLFFALYLRGLHRPMANSDEAIYAELGRSMVESGDWLTPRWQGKPVWNRPPASVWPIAIAMKIAGPHAWVIRLVGAFEAAVVLVLLFFLGRRQRDLRYGLVAALVLGASTLVLLYARSMVAEWVLLIGLLAALLCWEKGRDDPRWLLGWGFFLGLCLLTKQVVGAVPLVACLADILGRKRIAWRYLGWGCLAALLLWGGWIAIETWRFGAVFLYQHLVVNVLERGRIAMLDRTGPTYYLQMLWVLEGPPILLVMLGLGLSAWRRDFLPVLWGLGTLLLFSLSATRFNYYALLAYPALALGMASLLAEMGRWWLTCLVVLAWTVAHLSMPGGFLPQPVEDPELGTLAETMGRVSLPDDPLVTVGLNPYSARFYSHRKTTQLVSQDKGRLSVVVLESDRVQTSDVAGYLAQLPRWFAIVKVEDAPRLAALSHVFLVVRSGRYLLATNSAAPAR
jgi:4-amino-4-deoxy-L-arabinose transferase-like glycosyltransferase